MALECKGHPYSLGFLGIQIFARGGRGDMLRYKLNNVATRGGARVCGSVAVVSGQSKWRI